MKKFVFFTFLFVLSFFSVANASTKVPLGFRDIKLNSLVTGYKDMYKTGEAKRYGDGWSEFWKRRSDKLSIGNIKLKSIDYSTFFRKIYRIEIMSEDPRCDILKETIVKLYGKPKKVEDKYGIFSNYTDHLYWQFDNGVKIIYIHALNKNNKKYTLIWYRLEPLYQQCHQYMKEQVEKQRQGEINKAAEDM